MILIESQSVQTQKWGYDILKLVERIDRDKIRKSFPELGLIFQLGEEPIELLSQRFHGCTC